MSEGEGTAGLAVAGTASETSFDDAHAGCSVRSCPRARPPRSERTFIEIVLLDEDDAPIAGESYRIELPDGRVVSGALGVDGKARVEGIDPGRCNVTFPELDEEVWEPTS